MLNKKYFSGSDCVFLRMTLLKVIVLCRKIMKYLKIDYRLLVYFTSLTGCSGYIMKKLEDLKVLGRSPDLHNNCKTGQGQLQLIMKHILFYHIWGLQSFWSSNLNNLTAK